MSLLSSSLSLIASSFIAKEHPSASTSGCFLSHAGYAKQRFERSLLQLFNMPKATGDKRYKPSSVVKSNVSSAVYTPRNLRNTRERQAYRDAQILKESGADHPQQSSDTAGTTTGTTEYPPSKYGFHILTTKKKIEEGDHMRIPLPHGANPALPDADFVIMEYRGLNQGDKKATDWILMTSTPVNVTSKGPEQFMKILNNHNIHGYDSKKFSNTTEIFRNGQSLGTITEMKARALGR